MTTTAPAAPAAPATVRTFALSVRPDHGAEDWQWAVLGEGDWFAQGRTPARNREDAVLCALAAVHARLTCRGGVRLVLGLFENASFWQLTDHIDDAYPGLDLVPAGSEFIDLMKQASDALARGGPAPVRVRSSRQPAVTVATDGSASSGALGWGWLALNGRHGVGGVVVPRREVTGASRALVAEVAAIADAVQSLPGCRLTVLTDSKNAISLIEDWALGLAAVPRGYQRVQSGAPRAVDLMHLREVLVANADRIDLQWVPGHSGHALNEGADALAKMGRRRLESRWREVYDGTVTERAAQVAQSFTAHQSDFVRGA